MNTTTDRSTAWRHWRPWTVSVLALALAACASSRGLQPQGELIDTSRLESGRSLAGVPLSEASWPASDWWRALGDAQLDALVAEGLQHNPGLEAADARLRLAQAEVGTARADRLPSASVSGGYTGLRLPESMVGDELGGRYAGSSQAMVNFSYGVDLWGGKRATWEAAVDTAHAAEVDARAARLELSAGIVQAYAALDHAWQLQDVADDELQRATRTLELTGQRRAAGIDSELQVRQAQARIPAARQQQQAAALQIEQARMALAALLGQGPDRGLDIARPQALQPLALQLPEVLPSGLLGRRPDIVAARWRVEAADRGIHAAKARFYPSFNITALAGVVAPAVSDLLESNSAFGYLGPALSLPLFDGGRLRAGLARSDAQYDAAVASYNQLVLQALQQVAEQAATLRSLQQQTLSQQDALETVQAAHDLAEQRYRAGIGSYLEVLSVQEQLLQARQRMAGLHARQVQAGVALSQALGGGFVADPPDAAPASAAGVSAAAAGPAAPPAATAASASPDSKHS